MVAAGKAFFQAKRSINNPNDQFEQEADAVANKVMGMEQPFIQLKPLFVVPVQRKELSTVKLTANNATNYANTLNSSGEPLPTAVRNFYEPRFGYDFGNVKIHTGSAATNSAQSVNALAYTIGNHIAFDNGQYEPDTVQGRKLLTHELAHVVQQQTQDGVPAIQRLVRTARVNNCAPNSPYFAERTAVQFLNRAIERVQKAMSNRETDAADADVVAVRYALWTAFRLGNTDRVWNERLPVILRRMEAVHNYIESVVFQYECCPVGACPASTCGLTCDPPDNAFMCDNNTVLIVICPHFWTIDNNERGRTIAHEVFHLTFGFIGDWDQPDFHNAHCYAQFMLLLNGINPPPARRCH